MWLSRSVVWQPIAGFIDPDRVKAHLDRRRDVGLQTVAHHPGRFRPAACRFERVVVHTFVRLADPELAFDHYAVEVGFKVQLRHATTLVGRLAVRDQREFDTTCSERFERLDCAGVRCDGLRAFGPIPVADVGCDVAGGESCVRAQPRTGFRSYSRDGGLRLADGLIIAFIALVYNRIGGKFR